MTLRFAGAAFASTLVLSASALFAGCGGGENSTTSASSSGSGTPGGTGGAAASSGSGQGGGLFDAGVGSGSGGGSASYLIYAHTNTTLFTLDPTAPMLPLTKIGDFDCVGLGAGQVSSMTDIAVNEKGDIWTVSAYALHPITIMGNTVHCGTAIQLNNPNQGDPNKRFYGLSFAPVGVLDTTKEVLVAGNTAGELWSIDSMGNVEQHGAFGNVPADDGNGHKYLYPGGAWELSGDIVFLANKGSPVGFATVRDCLNPPSPNTCNKINTLLEIDVAALKTKGAQNVTKKVRGQIVQRPNNCNDGLNGDYGAVYGIASWNDHVYGFARKFGDGNLVDITISDGTACLVQTYMGNAWAGAGVSTLAPIIPPPN